MEIEIDIEPMEMVKSLPGGHHHYFRLIDTHGLTEDN